MLRQLLALALLAGAAAGAGWLVVRRLPVRGRREALAVAAAAGLGVLGTALFFVGLAGGLRRWVVLLLGVAALAGLAPLVRALRRWPVPPRSGGEAFHLAFDPGPRLAAVALVLALLPTFWWSLFPPTGFDATAYHLPYVRAFVATHRLAVVPEVLFPVFPQLGETLFAAVLLVAGADVTTHVVQLLALALGALLLDAAGRRFFSPAAGLWAAALWLAHPLAHYQAASAYIDLLMALFCLLAVIAWEAWREERTREDSRPAGGWLVLAGAAAGFAAATKYVALIWLGALGLVGLAGAPRRRRLVAGAVLGLAAVAVAAPWYLRIHHHTGNPFHPFLGSVFGDEASMFDNTLGVEGAATPGEGAAMLARGAGRALARPAALPTFAWRASFDRRWFDRQAALAPWYWLLTPLAAAFCLRDRRLLRWLAIVALYALLWTTLDPRYQLPSMALLALAGAGGLHHLAARFPSLGRRLGRPAAAWGLALALALPGPAYAVYKVLRLGAVPPATAEARRDHLDRQLAGHQAIRLLDERHGGDYTVFVLGGQYLTFHTGGRLLGHSLGPWRDALVRPLLGDPAALHRELAGMGVTHLLAVHDRRPVEIARDATFHRLFRAIPLADERAELFALVGDGAAPAPPPAPGER